MHGAQCALHTQPFPSSQLPQALWRHHRSQPSFAPSSPEDDRDGDGIRKLIMIYDTKSNTTGFIFSWLRLGFTSFSVNFSELSSSSSFFKYSTLHACRGFNAMKDVKRGSRPQKRITILQLSSVHYVLQVTRDLLLLYCSSCSRYKGAVRLVFLCCSCMTIALIFFKCISETVSVKHPNDH